MTFVCLVEKNNIYFFRVKKNRKMERTLTVLVTGSCGVGKTSLIKKFLSGFDTFK